MQCDNITVKFSQNATLAQKSTIILIIAKLIADSIVTLTAIAKQLKQLPHFSNGQWDFQTIIKFYDTIIANKRQSIPFESK